MERSKFRGLVKVETQFLLTATALNLKKIVKMLYMEKVKSRISEKIYNIIQIGKNILGNLGKELAIEEP